MRYPGLIPSLNCADPPCSFGLVDLSSDTIACKTNTSRVAFSTRGDCGTSQVVGWRVLFLLCFGLVSSKTKTNKKHLGRPHGMANRVPYPCRMADHPFREAMGYLPALHSELSSNANARLGPRDAAGAAIG